MNHTYEKFHLLLVRNELGSTFFRQERMNCGHMQVSKLYIEEVMNICVSFYQCGVFSLGSLSPTSFAI